MNDASTIIDLTESRSQDVGSGDLCWVTVAVLDPAILVTARADD